MFLTPCLRRIFTEPANHNKPRQTKTPAGSSRGASGGGLYYMNFSAQFALCGLPGAVHAARLTPQDLPCRVSQRQAAATQTRRACPHEPTQSNETPHGNTSSDNHQPASPQ